MFAKFSYEYVKYEELYSAYLDCRKRKRRTVNASLFELDVNLNLYNLWYDLNSKKYNIGRSIVFVVDKPVKREVFAADFRDRIVHHLLINRINSILEKKMIEDSYSCRVGKGTEYGVLQCKKYIEECSDNYEKDAYILKCDIKSFFMNISKTKLYNKIANVLNESNVFSDIDLEYNKWLLKLIIFNKPQKNCIRKQDVSHWNGLPKNKSLFYCDEDVGLPIGNLTSQIFANFYLSDFDKWITEIKNHKFYGRYVDDFFVISNDKNELLTLVCEIKDYLNSEGVILHPNKIYLQHVKKGVKFVGTVIKNKRLYISKRTVGNSWSAFKRINYLLTNYEYDIDIINYCISVVNSYMGFMKHKNTYNIRKKIFKLDFLKPLWKYCYYNKQLDKVTLFDEYTQTLNTKKHLNKEEYLLIEALNII